MSLLAFLSVPPLGSYKLQLGGTFIFHRCCFILSLTLLITRSIFISINMYIYILYMYVILSSLCLWVFCTYHTFHFTIRNDQSEQVCVCVCVSLGFLVAKPKPLRLQPLRRKISRAPAGSTLSQKTSSINRQSSIIKIIDTSQLSS